MSQQLTITSTGQHKKAKKLFYTDKSLIHREGKKAFLTVGGVHRLVYSSGITWNKYNCEIQYNVITHYERTDKSNKLIGTTGTMGIHYSVTLMRDYGFSDYMGFYQVGMAFHFSNIESVGSTPIGAYVDSGYPEVRKIISIDRIVGDIYYVTYEIVDACEEIRNTTIEGYTKGTTSYGEVVAEEGAFPEDGTLIMGSVEDGRCVLNVNGEYYYYVTSENDGELTSYSAKLDSAIIGLMQLEE